MKTVAKSVEYGPERGREGQHLGVSAGVLLLLYNGNRSFEVLRRLQWLLDLAGKELSLE